MKKELKVIAVVLVAILVFVCGFGLGASKGINITIKSEGTPAAAPVTEAPQTTVAPTTAPAPATEPSTSQSPIEDAVSEVVDDASQAIDAASEAVDNVSQAVDNIASGVPATPDAVVAAYVKAVNDLKHNTGNVTVHKTSNVDLHVTDCSVGFLRGTVDSLVQKFITGSDDTWTFSNGSDAEGRTLVDKIVPSNKDAALSASQCAQATAAAEGDGYTMTIKLNQETSTYDGTNTVYPEAHSSCLDPLNLATLDLGPAQITEANMTYSGATMTVTVDGQGRLTKYVINLPMQGTGTGKLGASLTIGIEGAMDDTYEVSYS